MLCSIEIVLQQMLRCLMTFSSSTISRIYAESPEQTKTPENLTVDSVNTGLLWISLPSSKETKCLLWERVVSFEIWDFKAVSPINTVDSLEASFECTRGRKAKGEGWFLVFWSTKDRQTKDMPQLNRNAFSWAGTLLQYNNQNTWPLFVSSIGLLCELF